MKQVSIPKPALLCRDYQNMHDVETLSTQLKGKVSDKTITNYGSAMKQYIAMVKEMNL
ncbi:MAG: hypothetical protein JRE64_09495 [Deltaproteobacteria bacterium]|nr:hypothetical protein [Deltaproteobacteria bacterium]